jgi:ATP-binding cassette, subfamily B, bacterial
MNYTLNKKDAHSDKAPILGALKKMLPFLADEKRRLLVAGLAVIVSAASNLVAPVVVGRTIDVYIKNGDFAGVLAYSGMLLAIFCIGLAAGYVLTITMGTVGRNVLWKMRNTIFAKLQELPIAFFNQNQAGDLISRVNNDTDKLNQLFAHILMQFVSNAFLIAGAAVLIVSFNWRLGTAALAPALAVFAFTRLASGWVKDRNAKGLKTLGAMSAEIQESLSNFRVIIAFNRLDYFRQKFSEANALNYEASVKSGIANNVFTPAYSLASSLAQIITLVFGVGLIATGNLTVGLLIGFFLYVNGFYSPLRQIAALWSSLQLALASFDRISEILSLKSDLAVIPSEKSEANGAVLELREVSFGYPDGQEILRKINFTLEAGKTYAFVGPTGGGKTTTASLMARLYDPTSGTVFLDGRDIRSYEPSERAKKIGFILQEPFLFTGTVHSNLVYGNEEHTRQSPQELARVLAEMGLDVLLERFENGLETKIAYGSDTLSLGQKQVVAFIRAVLRRPQVLILDEATANIDTVTETALDEIVKKLPPETAKVIIAHRLNTIQNADVIFFVNGGEIVRAGSMEQAVSLLTHGKRES